MAQTVKCLPAIQETWVRTLGWEDPLEKEMATHSSTLAWKIPWTESLVGYSPWGRKESDTTEGLHFHFHGDPLEMRHTAGLQSPERRKDVFCSQEAKISGNVCITI